MTNMFEGVINFGTAYAVRSRGFTAPAAGKTGTSHDGWFAGYTSNLLCIVGRIRRLQRHSAERRETAAPVRADLTKRRSRSPSMPM